MQTDIVSVDAHGDVQLTTGGWRTGTTMMAMNDALKPVGMDVRNVHQGMAWVVVQRGSVQPRALVDGMVVSADGPAAAHRARRVLQHAQACGIACVVHAPVAAKHAAGSTTVMLSTPPAAAAAAAWGGSWPPTRPAPSTCDLRFHAPPPAAAVKPTSTTVKPTSTTVTTAAVLNEVNECVMCMEVVRDTVIVPCGHLLMCSGCLEGMVLCPMCRGPIESLVCLNL
jgi:1-acyl-sn-glycerol-3-phosphate acyltransferase